MIKKHLRALLLICSLPLWVGCLVQETSLSKNEGSNSSSLSGVCLSAEALSGFAVEVNFAYPSGAQKFSLYRNGTLVFSTSKSSYTSFTDSDLIEGTQYIYTCKATVGDEELADGNELIVTTDVITAPTFDGIKTVAESQSTVATVTWSAPKGSVLTKSFKFYASLSSSTSVIFNETAIASTSNSSLRTYNLTTLGDELPYYFGVRACSSDTICDTNTQTLSLTLADKGAPTTMGASSVVISNATLQITAPWEHSNGAVKKRYIYLRSGAVGGTTLSNYTLVKTYSYSSSQMLSPDTTLEYSGLSENTTYWVLVVDEDPSGNKTTPQNPLSITTGDLTAPTFPGISGLVRVSPQSSSLKASWTAIDSEIVSSSGASNYYIYTLNSSSAITASACSSGNLAAQVSADSYTSGQTVEYTLTGLTSKNYYRVCVKAVDAAGNISNTTTYLDSTTYDQQAPSFDGIQGLTYDVVTEKLSVSWNQSFSSDIETYRLVLWANSVTEPMGATQLSFLHSGNPTGASISSSSFPFSSGDLVYAYVNACDSNGSPFGSTNCTTLATPITYQMPDIQPPQNFSGIRGPSDLLTPAEGQVTVSWFAPPSWTDFRGFRVYIVDPTDDSLTLASLCQCSANNCPDNLTQCTVTGLDPFRTYRFHVRAYDQEGNETTYLDPATNYSEKRTTDTTNPTFASALSALNVSPFTLSWQPATDNQYASESGATISYQVYQKVGSNFANSTTPYSDGSLRITTGSTSYDETGLTQGSQVYFSLCALDTSNNRTCDGVVRTYVVPDYTKPTVANLGSNKTSVSKAWNLTWSMTDNSTSLANLRVRVFRSYTSTSGTATTSDELIHISTGTQTITNTSGPPNQDTWVNYLVQIEDEAGNKGETTLSVYSENIVTITSVGRNTGSTAGNDLVLIKGTGFTKGSENGIGTSTEVSFAGNACTSVNVITSTLLTCLTPSSGVASSVLVSVNNPEGSSGQLASGYNYLSSSGHICDNPGSWGTHMASGAGSPSDPFIICNSTHFLNLAKNTGDGAPVNYRNGDFNYRLGANIDLDGIDISSMQSNYFEMATFDGDGLGILNYSITKATSDTGLFGRIYSAYFKNIAFLNFSVSGVSNTGGIAGTAFGSTNDYVIVDNVIVSGDVNGTGGSGNGVAGMFGYFRYTNTTVESSVKNSSFVGTVNAPGFSSVGGVIGWGYAWGYIKYYVDNVTVDADITGVHMVGGILGRSASRFVGSNISVKGTIQSTGDYVGGIVGRAEARDSIESSLVEASISSNTTSGGLVGVWYDQTADPSALSYVDDSYFSGSVSVSSGPAGGLVGLSYYLQIKNSHAKADLTGSGSIGGLVGSWKFNSGDSSVENSYFTGAVYADNDAGGIVGYLESETTAGSLNMTFSKIKVNANLECTSGSGGRMAGIIGALNLPTSVANRSVILDKISVKGTIGSDSIACTRLGGVVGWARITETSSSILVKNAHLTPKLEGGTPVGGVIGHLENYGLVTTEDSLIDGALPGIDSNRYLIGYSQHTGDQIIANTDVVLDTEAAGRTTVSNESHAGLTPTSVTTSEAKNQSHAAYSGWDFSDVWEWTSASGVYPTLKIENQALGSSLDP